MRRRTPQGGKKVPKAQLRLPFEVPTEAERFVRGLRLLEPAVWQACLTRNGRVASRVGAAIEKLKRPGAKISDLSLHEVAALETLRVFLGRGGVLSSHLADRRGPRGPDIDLYHRKLTELQRRQKP